MRSPRWWMLSMRTHSARRLPRCSVMLVVWRVRAGLANEDCGFWEMDSTGGKGANGGAEGVTAEGAENADLLFEQEVTEDTELSTTDDWYEHGLVLSVVSCPSSVGGSGGAETAEAVM